MFYVALTAQASPCSGWAFGVYWLYHWHPVQRGHKVHGKKCLLFSQPVIFSPVIANAAGSFMLWSDIVFLTANWGTVSAVVLCSVFIPHQCLSSAKNKVPWNSLLFGTVCFVSFHCLFGSYLCLTRDACRSCFLRASASCKRVMKMRRKTVTGVLTSGA